MLENIIVQDVYAGRGAASWIHTGDLAQSLVEHFPAFRARDLVLIDPSEADRVVTFNPVASVHPSRIDVGRLTVGRFECGRGLHHRPRWHLQVASSSLSLINGNFFVRGPQGQYYSMTWGTGGLGDPAADQGRSRARALHEPDVEGFIFNSSIAERGDYWGSMLRYASEFSGFRIAAGFGYERIRDSNTGVTLDPASPLFVGPQPDIMPGAAPCRSCMCRPVCSSRATT